MTAFQHVHDMQFYLLRTNLKDLLYHAAIVNTVPARPGVPAHFKVTLETPVNHVQDCIFLLLHVH